MINSYIALDLETTGLNPKQDKIIEIGAVRVENGQETGRFHTMLNPHRELEERITELTGIAWDMLKDAPDIGDILEEFLAFCGELPLLGHRIIFDYSFVKRAAVNQGLSFEKNGIDTLTICRRFMPAEESKRLGAACAFYGAGRCVGCPSALSETAGKARSKGSGNLCRKAADLQGKTGTAGLQKAKRGLAVFTKIS